MTCLRSHPTMEPSTSDAPQPRQSDGECVTTLSGCSLNGRVWPGCPGCPPGRLPEGRRKLLVRLSALAALAAGGSFDGGKEELCESLTTVAASSSAMRRLSWQLRHSCLAN